MRRLMILITLLACLAAPAAMLAGEVEPAEAQGAETEGAAAEAAEPAEDKNEKEPEPAWNTRIGLSYLSTSGNTDTQSGGLDLRVERRPDPWGLDFSALITRAEESGITTADRTFATLRGVRELGKRWQVFTGLSHEEDRFAGIEQRRILEAGTTYEALPGPIHTLSVDLGLNATHEDLVEPDPDSDYMGALAGIDYEWKLSETASLGQRLVYYADFEDSANWRLKSNTAISANLTTRLALRVSYDLRHRNQPIGASDDTDTETRISLVLNL